MSGAVRWLLEAERVGMLATISARRAGWPFASLAPFAVSAAGEPVFLLSELAEHTRNARADARVSLLVCDSACQNNPQAGTRVTLLGRLQPLAEGEASNAMREAYVLRHPEAAEYAQFGDFHVFELMVAEARLIGGFGDMGWLTGDRLREALAV